MKEKTQGLDTAKLLEAEVISPEEWGEISRGWAVSDPERIFVSKWGKPLYINRAFPKAAEVKSVCSALMHIQYADCPEFEPLYTKLVNLVGTNAAFWFHKNAWLDRYSIIRAEEQKARAEEWLNTHDVIEILDSIPTKYDSMYKDFWRFDEKHVGADAAFVYGYLIGKAEAAGA